VGYVPKRKIIICEISDAKSHIIRSLPLAVLKRKTTKAPPLVKSDGAPVERVTLLMSASLV